MAFELAPDPGDRGEPDVKLGRVGGSAVGEHRLVRDGMQVLARGALACPECDLPISPAPRVPPRAELRCGYCDHTAEARSFFRRDLVDVTGNDVRLVARVG